MTERALAARIEGFGGTVLPDRILLHIRFQAELAVALSLLGGVFDAHRKRWSIPRAMAVPLVQVLEHYGAQPAENPAPTKKP